MHGGRIAAYVRMDTSLSVPRYVQGTVDEYNRWREMTRLIYAGFLILVATNYGSATDPAPHTFIVREDGVWRCPRHFSRDLVIKGSSRHERKLIKLESLFPGDLYERNVSETSAGPFWGEASLYYVFRKGDTSP